MHCQTYSTYFLFSIILYVIQNWHTYCTTEVKLCNFLPYFILSIISKWLHSFMYIHIFLLVIVSNKAKLYITSTIRIIAYFYPEDYILEPKLAISWIVYILINIRDYPTMYRISNFVFVLRIRYEKRTTQWYFSKIAEMVRERPLMTSDFR